MHCRINPGIALSFAVITGCASPSDPGAPTPDTSPENTIPYTPGKSYFGRNNYIEYIAGNAPIIFTAPHGGSLTPSEIPGRASAVCGGAATTTTDLNTDDLVRSMQQQYFARFGKYPHIVIVHLARSRLDANRTNPEAACGDTEANVALNEWHAFIDAAKKSALASSSKVWYMDMHGHGHSIQRLELGYMLSSQQLNLSDAAIDANAAHEDTASVRTLSESAPITLSELLRGSSSLGTLYASRGFRSIPSSADPRPGGDTYFPGGDNTRRHTCGAEATGFGGVAGGNVCGVQVEANYTGVRDNALNRDRFGEATALVLEQYLRTHWGLHLDDTPRAPNTR